MEEHELIRVSIIDDAYCWTYFVLLLSYKMWKFEGEGRVVTAVFVVAAAAADRCAFLPPSLLV